MLGLEPRTFRSRHLSKYDKVEVDEKMSKIIYSRPLTWGLFFRIDCLTLKKTHYLFLIFSMGHISRIIKFC